MISRIFTIMIISLNSSLILGQDILIKNDGNELKSKVIEISDLTIKYKMFDNLNGPVYSINKNDVLLIIYENGKREHFSTSQNVNKTESSTTETNSQFSERHRSSTFGLGLTGFFGAFAYNSVVSDGDYASSLFIGPLSYSRNLGITPKFAFHYGSSVSYMNFRQTYYGFHNDFDAIIPSIDFGGSFHFSSKKKIDPYIKIVTGLAYWIGLSGDFHFSALTPNYGLKFGANFYGKRNSGFNLEVGYELFSYLKIGYTFGNKK